MGRKSGWDNERSRGSCPALLPYVTGGLLGNGLPSKLRACPAEVALHGPGRKPADCLEQRGSTPILKHPCSHAYSHTQGAPVVRILHWARGENKGEGWSNVQSIGKKGQAQQGLKKALPQPFSLFSKSWPRILLCKSVCLKEQGQWILILFTPQSGPTKIHSIDGWQRGQYSLSVSCTSLNVPNHKQTLPSKHQILD